VNQKFNLILETSQNETAQMDVAAGECVMMGNPSTHGSSRVHGADRVYEFSPVLNQYIETDLIGVGRAAWVCNDNHSGRVTLGYEGDQVPGFTWPACCDRGPTPNQGKGLFVFQNDSPVPLIVGLRQTDADGNPLMNGDGVAGSIAACDQCRIYAPGTFPGDCSGNAITLSFNMAPGTYVLHAQVEDSNFPDLQADIMIQPDEKYVFCFHKEG
jgi:hypothetical protein